MNLPQEMCRQTHGSVCVYSMAVAIDASRPVMSAFYGTASRSAPPGTDRKAPLGVQKPSKSRTFSHLIIKSQFFIKICRIRSLTISMSICISQELLLAAS